MPIRPTPEVNVLFTLDTADYPWCTNAALVEVRAGRGSLRMAWTVPEEPDYMSRQTLLLNGVPLVRGVMSPWGTGASMLATGHGVAHASEFVEAENAINAPYAGFEDAIDRIAPVLGLLPDGLVAVAEANLFPSDGDGRFFWDVPNTLTLQPATQTYSVFEEDIFASIGGCPAYLYPSQSTSRFDPDRVAHYRELVGGSDFPRALAYDLGGLMAVLLDGHHKAAACVLAGAATPCLVIQPTVGLAFDISSNGRRKPSGVRVGGFRVDASRLTRAQLRLVTATLRATHGTKNVTITEDGLIERSWPSEYANSWKRYPQAYDFAVAMAVATADFDLGRVDQWLEHPVGNAGNLRAAIVLLSSTDSTRCRDVALRALRVSADRSLMLTAFWALDVFHDDEVDQVFIDYLVGHDDKYDQARHIADHHWDGLA